jgi:hypothetical protein
MSFSRIKYDNEAYDLQLNRSVAPGDYRLFQNYNENCDKCYPKDGVKNSKSDSAITRQWGDMAEAESLLTNRVNKLIDHNEYGSNDMYKNIPIITVPDCGSSLAPEDTRFSYPLEAFRSMDTTNYHYTPHLFSNPQCEIQEDRIGMNSRLRVKDTFKPTPPKLVDQESILPNRGMIMDNELSEPSSMQNVCKNLLN